MSSSSYRMVSCSHTAVDGEATVSMTVIAPSQHEGATPMPRQYHINLTRGQVDSITLGLQRVAQQLGGSGEEE